MKRMFPTVALIAAVAVLYVGCRTERKEFFVEPAQSEVVAVAGCEEAAGELAYHLGLIAGREIPVVASPRPGSYVWHVGKAPEDAVPAVNPEEAHWRIGDSCAWFYGGERNGARHAVMGFLEDSMGVRWPFGTNVFFRAMSPFRFAVRSGDWSPELLVREVRPGTGRKSMSFTKEAYKWAVRMREGSHNNPDYGHAFTRYWTKYARKHPDIFAMRYDGRRMPFATAYRGTAAPDDPAEAAAASGAPYKRMAMCPSSETLRRIVIGSWLSDGTNKWINLCENDARGAWSCRCKNCLALDTPPVPGHFWERKHVWYADRYVNFANAVLAEAKKYRPDVKACMYAYFGTQEAPRRERLDESLVVGLVPVDFTEPGMKMYVDSWKKAGLKSFFYRPNRHYYFRSPDFPLGCERYFFNVWKYLRSQGAVGFDYDSPGNLSSFEWFRDYVIVKAMQDPEKSFEYWEDHYMQSFGAAADDVKACFRHWREEVWAKRIKADFGSYERILRKGASGGNIFREMQKSLSRYYHREDFEKTLAMLETGLKRPGLTDCARANVEALLADHRISFRKYLFRCDAVPVHAFGYTNRLPEDCTSMINGAIQCGAGRIVFGKFDKDWVTSPVDVKSGKLEVLIEKGVVIRTKDGETDLNRIFRTNSGKTSVKFIYE